MVTSSDSRWVLHHGDDIPHDMYRVQHYVDEGLVHLWRYNRGDPELYGVYDQATFNFSLFPMGTMEAVFTADKG